ncbi:unnamed protein product [Allacma fusca]|uniref:Vacuolar protein sorting-associated protein 45 n=1 Tax=Allacma fusca TaxID=39272 RepID=A0A8J2KD56_9HEXA|nr:unnamed protein product [Allacma fusca]
MIQSCGPGMKILLMDKETTAVVSTVYAQSEIMEKEVYLCDRLDNISNRESLRHLKCLTFLRPSQENIHLLAMELKSPMYGSYFLHWTNVISKSDVKRLAEADEQEVVREICELFADFIPLSPHCMISSIPVGPVFAEGDLLADGLTHNVASVIISFLLAVKKYPIIRYTEGSMPTQKLADKIHNLINKESNLFDFHGRNASRPVLLILDRRDDSLTPLLNQWTYQAMVHELLTIKNHRVSLANAPGIHKDFREVVLTPDNDTFYANNMYADFGAVGQSLRQLVEEFQAKAKTHQKVESIEDMKSFVENYPHFKQMSGTVSKHVAVVGELARLNEKYHLLEVSELEQELACHSNHSASLQKLKQLLDNNKIRDEDALRLVLLYALRYESHSNNDIVGLVSKLKSRGLSQENIDTVLKLLKFGGAKKRRSDLYGSDPVAVTKRLIKGMQGVENIYTQHTPWMKGIVEDLLKGRLREGAFPTFGMTRSSGASDMYRPSEVIVFILGGVTYAESLAIHNINRAENRLAAVVGGTTIHNMKSFLVEINAFNTKQKSHGNA